eukprot:scaffold2103_cov185-Amphora_coffeaeformis.AAC.26
MFLSSYSGPCGCHGEKWHCTRGKHSAVVLYRSRTAICRANLTHKFLAQIDSVLKPYYFYYGIASLAVEIQENVGLTTLVELVVCADLVEALDTTFGITVFAPTDDAFKALDLDTEYLCGDGKDELTKILTYHVVPGVFPASQIPAGKTYATTLQGEDVLIYNSGKYITVNGANVIAEDVLAKNGIVHLIDEVSFANSSFRMGIHAERSSPVCDLYTALTGLLLHRY